MIKKTLKCLGVVAIVVIILAVSLGLTHRHNKTIVDEDVRFFGDIKTITRTEVLEGYESIGIYQYIGYDINTKCMYYVYFRPYDWSFSTTPYTVQIEDGSVKQAVFGVDYK